MLGAGPITCLRASPHKVNIAVYDPPRKHCDGTLQPFQLPARDSASSQSATNLSSSSSDSEDLPVKRKKKKQKLAESRKCTVVNNDSGLVESGKIESWSASPEMKRLIEQKAVLSNVADWIGRLEDNTSMFVGACSACPIHCLSGLSKNVKGVPGRKKGQRGNVSK